MNTISPPSGAWTQARRALLRGRRLFISGARGFIGRHVLALGSQYEMEVHALSRAGCDWRGVQSWVGDITDEARITEILAKARPQCVIHLAAAGVEYGSGSLTDLVRVNCAGLASLLQSLARLDCPAAVVCASSGFEYAPKDGPLGEDDRIVPVSIYGASKAAAVPVAQYFAGRMPITLVRLFSLYGPGEQAPRLVPYIIQQVIAGQPVDLTYGEQVRDYTYVSDAAEALLTAAAFPPLDRNLRVVNFASGQATSLRELCEILGTALREKGFKVELRFGARPYRIDELMHYTANIGRWREYFGEPTLTPLERGLRRMVSQLRPGL